MSDKDNNMYCTRDFPLYMKSKCRFDKEVPKWMPYVPYCVDDFGKEILKEDKHRCEYYIKYTLDEQEKDRLYDKMYDLLEYLDLAQLRQLEYWWENNL